MRGLVAFLGVILTVTGVIVCWVTWTANAWAVIAAIGFALILIDLAIEHYQHRLT